VAAKAKTVAERNSDGEISRLVRNAVEVAGGVDGFVVDRRRGDILAVGVAGTSV
jgi:hypothetical protein